MAAGKHFLLTGNAMEVFGKTIQDGEKTISGLGLLDLTARRIPAQAGELPLSGRFSGGKDCGLYQPLQSYGELLPPLFTVEKGLGRSEGATVEGIRSGGVLGTYLLGPLLVLNPDFTRWLLDDLGAADTPLAFETEVRRAYQARLEQFQGNIEF
ncbi:MAG: hypothetical protein ACLUNQ_08195 [Oscillospiraceae bacterium]